MAHKKGQGSSRNGRDSNAQRLGTKVGDGQTVTSGIVSGKSRSLPDGTYVPFIQTDVAINPGNSGGQAGSAVDDEQQQRAEGVNLELDPPGSLP